jgi:hypothetical protein
MPVETAGSVTDQLSRLKAAFGRLQD